MSEANTNPNTAPWWQPWSLPWSVAPQTLTQPINPGWSFGAVTVNNVNSSAPDVEREIVSRHSYGRQIGRLVDAVAVLADALPKTAADPRIKEFHALAEQIREIKKQTTVERMERLRRELQEIKETDPDALAEIRALLR